MSFPVRDLLDSLIHASPCVVRVAIGQIEGRKRSMIAEIDQMAVDRRRFLLLDDETALRLVEEKADRLHLAVEKADLAIEELQGRLERAELRISGSAVVFELRDRRLDHLGITS